MNFATVKDHLMDQFSGQLVLYVDDLAKVLGKSEKAISNLIARDSLPFKVTTIGGLRCVDIFQVAQWLSTEPDMAQESVAVQVKPALPKTKSRASKPVGLTSVQTLSSTGQAPVPTGKVAAMLLKMRHATAQAMGRFVYGLHKPDDVAFMNEVMEKLYYSADSLKSSYVVTFRKLALNGFQVLAEETRRYFDCSELAEIYVLEKMTVMRYAQSMHSFDLRLDKSPDTLFHAIASINQLEVIRDSVGFDLPGL